MAECTVQERTNADLLAHAARKEAKKKRQKGNIGVAMVMNKEVLDEREEYNSWYTEWDRLKHIHLNIFGRQKKKKPAPATPARQALATPVRRAPATPARRALATPARRAPATPVRRAPATPARRAKATPARRARARLRVTLRVRVSTQDLERGLWSRRQQEQQQHIRERQQEQQYEARDLHGQQIAREQRTRRPRTFAY